MRAPSWWTEAVLPRLVDRAMRGEDTDRFRERVCRLPGVRGEVLELGFGSGLNLAFYGDDVCRVLAVEPADLAWELAQDEVRSFGRPVQRVGTDAARLDLPDASVDAVVSTWTLCTIPDLAGALAQVARVLRPGGALVFVEHTRSHRPLVAGAQRAVQPVWGMWAGGCHLDRDILGEVTRAAYELTDVRRNGWFVSGRALPRSSGG